MFINKMAQPGYIRMRPSPTASKRGFQCPPLKYEQVSGTDRYLRRATNLKIRRENQPAETVT